MNLFHRLESGQFDIDSIKYWKIHYEFPNWDQEKKTEHQQKVLYSILFYCHDRISLNQLATENQSMMIGFLVTTIYSSRTMYPCAAAGL